ncbi:hypothetical protein SDC9_161084 [bioreactor metagenome]|uniref:Uncharacterized protein n=1 Tax=bioreactor metagenome TaxID=1076179 RepID=A0A645FH84_9ZZZZ
MTCSVTNSIPVIVSLVRVRNRKVGGIALYIVTLHDCVVGVGLGSFCKRIQYSLRVIVALFGYNIEVTGFYSVAKFDPFGNITTVPGISCRKRDRTWFLCFFEVLYGLVQVCHTAGINHIPLVIRRIVLGSHCLRIRHFAVQVKHHEES